MSQVTITLADGGSKIQVEAGATLSSIAPQTVTDPKTRKEYPVLAALVDHKIKALDFAVFYPHTVEFIGYNHPEGRRTYLRSLCFLAQRAARTLFPDRVFKINHSLPSGLYCKLRGERITDEQIMALREEMRCLVDENLPFTHRSLPAEEAIGLFEGQNQRLKADLIRSVGRFFCEVDYLDGVADNFYGALVPSTGYLSVFDLMPFHHGFCLQYPSDEDITRTIPRIKQIRFTSTLKDYGIWCKTSGIVSVSALNNRLLSGKAVELINLCEARQERKFAEVADRIYAERERVKIVFLAGPSSSGKTSSSLRVAQQLKVLGMNPKVIELDNYFV